MGLPPARCLVVEDVVTQADCDPEALVEAIPDLNRYGDHLQVFSELVLANGSA